MRNNKGESQAYQDFKLESEINAIAGAEVFDTPIQQLSSCVGGKVYRDLLTGQAFTPANLSDGVVRVGTWATANSDWKLASVKNMYDIFNSVALSTTGYQKLPSGLILQWGKYPNKNLTEITITYPIAFPNNVFSIVCGSEYTTQVGNVDTVKKGSITNTNFVVTSNNNGGSTNVSWIAIGN